MRVTCGSLTDGSRLRTARGLNATTFVTLVIITSLAICAEATVYLYATYLQLGASMGGPCDQFDAPSLREHLLYYELKYGVTSHHASRISRQS